MDVETITKLINSLGFPAVALIAMAYATRRVCIFLAPYVRKVLDALVSLFDTLRDNDTKHLANQVALKAAIGESDLAVHTKLDQVKDTVNEVREDVKLIKDWARPAAEK